MPDAALRADIEKFASRDQQDELISRLKTARNEQPETLLFDLAKIFYLTFFHSRHIRAVDLNGTATCLHHNLNEPLKFGDQFDAIINNGTAEHIFFGGQVFKSMHDATKPGGLMIHEGPLIQGWIDHGFANYQPTLFFALARHNDYGMMFFIGAIEPFQLFQLDSREEILSMAGNNSLPTNPVFLVVFKKRRP